jgi:hypothetical protein
MNICDDKTINISDCKYDNNKEMNNIHDIIFESNNNKINKNNKKIIDNNINFFVILTNEQLNNINKCMQEKYTSFEKNHKSIIANFDKINNTLNKTKHSKLLKIVGFVNYEYYLAIKKNINAIQTQIQTFDKTAKNILNNEKVTKLYEAIAKDLVEISLNIKCNIYYTVNDKKYCKKECTITHFNSEQKFFKIKFDSNPKECEINITHVFVFIK